jgi:hypothetical protein
LREKKRNRNGGTAKKWGNCGTAPQFTLFPINAVSLFLVLFLSLKPAVVVP